MTSVWDWVILVIVVGLVSTFEIGLVCSVIGRIVESKLKTHYELEIQYYDKVMDRFDKAIETFFDKMSELTNKETQPITKIGFGENRTEE